jgi:hypothetical protein
VRPLDGHEQTLPWSKIVHVFVFRALLLVCLVVGVTGRKAMAAEQEPILLEYRADEGCPSSTQFERMVFKRTHSARPARSDERARVFTISLRQAGTRVQGSLTVRDGDQSLVRRVTGNSCKELASVLALATALAIDPLAEISPEVEGTDPDALDPGTDPAAPPGTQAGTQSSAQSETQPGNQQASTATDSSAPLTDTPLPYDPPDALPSAPIETTFALSLGPELEWAATPNVAFGPSLGVELHAPALGWTLGVGLSALLTADERVSDADTNFRLFAARVQTCGLALRWHDTVQGGPCLGLQLGDLNASSSRIPFPEEVHKFWATIGVHFRVLVALDEHWHLHADVGPNLVLTQYRFTIEDPTTRIFEQGLWTGTGRLMLLYRY